MKRLGKRVTCFALSVLMVLSVMMAVPQRAEAATKPTLSTSTMKVNRKKATKGQTITYTFKISKCSRADLCLYSSTNGKWQSFQVPLKKKGSTFTAKLKVSNAIAPGTLKVMSIQAYYGEYYSNLLLFSAPDYCMKGEKKTNFKSLNVKITGTKGDYTAPSIKTSSFKVSKTKVKQYGAIKVSVKATDSMAGVETLMVGLKTPRGFTSSFVLDNIKYKNGVISGYFYPDEKGTYKIRSIEVEDKVGNRAVVLDKRFKEEKDYYDTVKMTSLKKWDFTVK